MQIWQQAFDQIVVAILIWQLLMIGLVGLKEAPLQAALMAPLPFITIIYRSALPSVIFSHVLLVRTHLTRYSSCLRIYKLAQSMICLCCASCASIVSLSLCTDIGANICQYLNPGLYPPLLIASLIAPALRASC